MADSWEDIADDTSNTGLSLNANAPSFVFNPSASEWSPSSTAPPTEAQTGSAAPAGNTIFNLGAAQKRAEISADPAKAAGTAIKEAMESESGKNSETASKEVEAAAEQVKKMQVKEEKSTPQKEKKGKEEQDVDDDEDEEDEDVDEQEVEEDPREHLNIVFIGHVDAGKSTLAGSILYHTGSVDKRTIERYEREAKTLNRESWFLAFIMDTNEEERSKGKTVEVGRAHLETENKRFTILDAPGHKNYVPNMISGAAQADVGILVISARSGEFETGFERGGQTREHAMLAKTLGVNKLIVVVNKMDDMTVEWSKDRFDECQKKLTPFLKGCGYAVKRDVQFIPISALTGINIKTPLRESKNCDWWTGLSLLEALDQTSIPGRDPKGPLRVPVLDRYLERGLCVLGKVESGTLKTGDKLVVVPTNLSVQVSTIYINEQAVKTAKPGENVKIRVNGASVADEIQKGFVLCDEVKPCKATKVFIVQLFLVELLEHRPVFSAGYEAIFHAHTASDECTVVKLLSETVRDPKTKQMKVKKRPTFVKQGATVTCKIETAQEVGVETFEEMRQLGRFTLRDEGRTIAIGKVLQIQ